jgi:hypothetical protein
MNRETAKAVSLFKKKLKIWRLSNWSNVGFLQKNPTFFNGLSSLFHKKLEV